MAASSTRRVATPVRWASSSTTSSRPRDGLDPDRVLHRAFATEVEQAVRKMLAAKEEKTLRGEAASLHDARHDPGAAGSGAGDAAIRRKLYSAGNVGCSRRPPLALLARAGGRPHEPAAACDLRGRGEPHPDKVAGAGRDRGERR